MIDKLRFADYFLFVNEIVAFARRQGIPVDVRGVSSRQPGRLRAGVHRGLPAGPRPVFRAVPARRPQ